VVHVQNWAEEFVRELEKKIRLLEVEVERLRYISPKPGSQLNQL
jgi:hypothetical protein